VTIPLVDLKAQHAEVAADVQEAFAGVLGATNFILGKPVAEFETAFASFSKVAHCIGVANGTDALEIALRALDIGQGHEVILPANTFVATALAVVRAGATPVLVDCDPQHHLIDPGRVEAAITPRTRALMPVHLYGQCAPMRDLMDIAERRGLMIIEDAAQAQGAEHNGSPVGSFGAISGTSFYPGKNLGAYGDAGALLTNSASLANRARALRNYGSEVKYFHPEIGFNSRLDTLQAVVLSAKLKRLGAWNEQRRTAANRYSDLLREHQADVFAAPSEAPGNIHVWHLYVVRVPRRDSVLERMNADGVGAGVHYPVPIHLQGAFHSLGHGVGAFPVTEKAAAEILSLPIYPQITEEQQGRVVEVLLRAVATGG